VVSGDVGRRDQVRRHLPSHCLEAVITSLFKVVWPLLLRHGS
jgi:hypothetical protein